MRLDKFLWSIRMFKTREAASQACKKGQVRIGENKVKASKEVFGGEDLSIRKNQINYQIIILDIPKARVGAKSVDLYRKDITDLKEIEKIKQLKYSSSYYREKGSGRPTKKDRREIDNYNESNYDIESNDS